MKFHRIKTFESTKDKFKDVFFRQKSDVMEAELQQKLTIIEQETKDQPAEDETQPEVVPEEEPQE